MIRPRSPWLILLLLTLSGLLPGLAPGAYAGGFTTGPVQPSLFNPTLDSGYALSLSQVPLGSFSTLTSGVGLGNSPYNTLAGDPVSRPPVRRVFLNSRAPNFSCL